MAKSNSYSSKWPRLYKSTYGLPNIWYQSKVGEHLRRKQHLDFIHRELKRGRQDQLGSCIKQISEDCKDMLKKKLQEIKQYNNTLNQPKLTNIAHSKYKNYKCFQCKQMGHIVKFCPMDNKDEDMVIKIDTSNLARERKKGFKATKPSVMLKYPESIHFSTKCMMKGTNHANWDDIWCISNQYLVHKTSDVKNHMYKLDFLCTISKEDGRSTKANGVLRLEYDKQRLRSVYFGIHVYTKEKLRTLMRNRFNKVVKWFYNHYLERSLLGPIPPTINGVHVHLFDLYKLIEGLGGYLSVYFSQEFDTIGEILGLSKGNGEEIKRCYINYLDVFTSYFKTARAPPQGNENVLDESTRNIKDKDRDCLVSHQWDFGETGAPMRKSVVLKDKKAMEHFGVKLEDTTDSQDKPIIPHSTRNQNLQGLLSRPSTSRMTENEDSSSNKSDD
ncbi:ARID DNA-binding domain-containing protein, partial [Tanacetum coccineum]